MAFEEFPVRKTPVFQLPANPPGCFSCVLGRGGEQQLAGLRPDLNPPDAAEIPADRFLENSNTCTADPGC